MRKSKTFTAIQKKALTLLLTPDNYLVHFSGAYRLRDKEHRPLFKVKSSTFAALFPYLRKKGQFWVMSFSTIRRDLTKKHWLKKQYIKKLSERKQETKIDEQLKTNNDGNNISGG